MKNNGLEDVPLTFIVTSKLHNVRMVGFYYSFFNFFKFVVSGRCKKVSSPAGKNIKPGHVVDTNIVHRLTQEFDFVQ